MLKLREPGAISDFNAYVTEVREREGLRAVAPRTDLLRFDIAESWPPILYHWFLFARSPGCPGWLGRLLPINALGSAGLRSGPIVGHSYNAGSRGRAMVMVQNGLPFVHFR